MWIFWKIFSFISKRVFVVNQLEELDGVYDAIIAGSDQVWNIACRDADDAYYLNFVQKTPKYAYAVSFGANNPFELGERNKYINISINLEWFLYEKKMHKNG